MSGEVPPSNRVAGMWVATFTGSRQQTITSIPTPILQTWTSSAYTIGHSVFFPGVGAVGSLTVDLSYTAAGVYVVAQSVHAIEWNPVLGMNTAGVDPAKPSAP